MKKRLIALILLAVMLMSLTSLHAFAKESEKDLIILHTSDVHCGIDQGWGYAGLYAVKQNLSSKYDVLLVDDGDAIQGEPIGTMTKGEAIIDIMNVMGYDVAIPGNHEFDYGVERFLELAKKANFPYISCNFNKGGELLLEPWLIKEIDGRKIGFIGVTTPATLRASTPRYFTDDNTGEFLYGFMEDKTGEALYSIVQKAVDDVRAAGADYVIVLGHLGNEAECEPWTYADVISHCSGIDALLDGHSHDTDQVVMKDKDGKDVIRSACGTKLGNIGVLHITCDGQISSELFPWNCSNSLPALLGIENKASEAVYEGAAELNEKLAEVVATSTVDLCYYDPETINSGKPVRIIRRAETNLGDFCADAYLDQSGADIAFINSGGIREPIAKGDITLNDILKVHPFGNMLTVIEVTGQQVLDALEWSVHALPGELGAFNQVAGLTFAYDSSIDSPCVQDDKGFFDHVDESMERRVRNVLVAGAPLDPTKTYTLASLDFLLLNHGGGYTMYDGAKVLQKSVKLDNQVLIDYITGTLGGHIGAGYENPYGQGRIISVNSES